MQAEYLKDRTQVLEELFVCLSVNGARADVDSDELLLDGRYLRLLGAGLGMDCKVQLIILFNYA